MNKSPQNQKVKEKIAFWLSDLATKISSVLLALLFLFLPTQLGKHFWPSFSLVNGIRVDYLSPTLYVTDILIGSLFVVWLTRFIMGFSRQLVSRNAIWRCVLWLLIVGFLSLNVLNADRIGLSSYYLVKLFEFAFLTYFIATNIRLYRDFPVIAVLFSVSAFFQSLLAIFQYFNQASLNGWLYYFGERMFNGATPGIANAAINGELILRPYATFPHPNVLAGFLLLSSIFIYFFQVRRANGFIKWFGVFVLLLSSVALLLSLSRVTIGLWVLFIGFFIFYQIFSRLRSLQSIILGCVFLIGSFVGFMFSSLGQTLLSRFAQTSFFEEALVQRNELVQSAVVMIASHPIIGVGFGNFIPALAPLQDPLSIGLYLQPVHNIYLLVAAEIGIIGLFLFLTLLFFTFRRLIINIHQAPLFRTEFLVLTLLLSIILFIGLFDHYFLTLQQGQLLFSILLGFCWAKARE